MQRLSVLFLINLLILLSSCERDVTANFAQADSQIVVEGYVENGKSPYVFLTRSFSFYGKIDSALVSNLSIQGAEVIVSTGNTFVKLEEKRIMGFSIYLAPESFKGEIGKTYQLRIRLPGKELTATTTIPYLVKPDSIKFKLRKAQDSLGFLHIFFRDPDTLGNYYRYFTANQKDGVDLYYTYTKWFNTVNDDGLVNGKPLDFDYPKGYVDGRQEERDDDFGFFHKKDTMYLKWCNLDYKHFRFWQTLESTVQSSGSPFANPPYVASNISGGLGIWGGYAAYYDTIIGR